MGHLYPKHGDSLPIIEVTDNIKQLWCTQYITGRITTCKVPNVLTLNDVFNENQYSYSFKKFFLAAIHEYSQMLHLLKI